MRLLSVGDIHGCFDALRTLEGFVPFSDDDLIVALGDYIDRGPNTREVVDWVMDRTDRQLCIPLRGNHEIMMLLALQGAIPLQHWLQFGGNEVLASYAPPGRRGTPNDIPYEHLEFLDLELLPYYETDGQLFVHASVAPDRPLQEQTEHDLFWERFDAMAPHVSGKTIICGHTAQHSGRPNDLGYAVCIDTWVYGNGWLTCLDVETGQYWQADQRGQTQTGRIASMVPPTEQPPASRPPAVRRPAAEPPPVDRPDTRDLDTDWLEPE